VYSVLDIKLNLRELALVMDIFVALGGAVEESRTAYLDESTPTTVLEAEG
jgi:hypothetical protein